MTARAAISPGIHVALNRLSTLVPLGEDDALLKAAAADAHVIPAHRDILVEGQPIAQAFLLLDGWAYRSRVLADGRRQILHFLLPGDLIGMCHHAEPKALTDTSALTNVILCPAPPAPQSPTGRGLGGLTEAYAISRALEEHYLLRQITRLGRMSAYERIVDWILETGDRLFRAELTTATGDRFPLPVTQEVMADMLGLTSVHVNRMLQAMARDGLLKVQGGKATILDRSRCMRIADFTSSFHSAWPMTSSHRSVVT